jgi:hypothetical protein
MDHNSKLCLGYNFLLFFNTSIVTRCSCGSFSCYSGANDSHVHLDSLSGFVCLNLLVLQFSFFLLQRYSDFNSHDF